MTKKAMKTAYKAHEGQTDKSGVPYIFHSYHVAEQMDTEDAVITALLHDVVEDTPLTLSDLEKEGFSKAVLEALALLTHDRNVPYMDYIHGLEHNEIALRVKIADLKHNSDISRLDQPDQKDRERQKKYRQALACLQNFQDAGIRPKTDSGKNFPDPG
jgi:(p)ppGpp synthase/HD superfamily hydrolase